MDNPSFDRKDDESKSDGSTHARNHLAARNGVTTGTHIRVYPNLDHNFKRGILDGSSSKVKVIQDDESIGLKKNIGFVSCVGILVGGIIGSGIFVSPKGVLRGTGSIGLALIVWTICGFISFIGSLAFAELGVLLPNSGGQYFYMLNGFDPNRKKEKSIWRSVIPFLYFWQVTFLSKPAAMAVQGMAAAQYLLQLSALGGCASATSVANSATVVKLLSAIFILIISFVNIHSNKLTTRLINVLTFSKLLALVFIIISGIIVISSGTNKALKTGFEGTTFSFDGLSTAFYSGLWACSGWDSLNMVTKELVNPKRDLLRSLMFTCALVTSVYLLANVAYFGILSKEEFLASNAVAVDYAKYVAGNAGVICMVISVASSIFGSTVGGTFTCVRLSYAAAREGHMVDFLSYIDHKSMTPKVALILNAFLSLVILPHSSILGLIALTGFLEWIFMFLTMVSLLILRKTKSRNEEDFKVPIIVPFIVMLFSLFLVVTPFIDNPKVEYIFVLLFLLLGVVFFMTFVYFEVKIPGLGKIKILVQKILLVLPSEDEDV